MHLTFAFEIVEESGKNVVIPHCKALWWAVGEENINMQSDEWFKKRLIREQNIKKIVPVSTRWWYPLYFGTS